MQPAKAWVRVARVFDKAGQSDPALYYYERYVKSTSLDLMLWSEALGRALARWRLAEMYEDEGLEGVRDVRGVCPSMA